MTEQTRIIQLVSIEGFIDAFWKEVKNHRTQQEAYEAVESEYEGIFGQRRYSHFNSFRVVRDRRCKIK